MVNTNNLGDGLWVLDNSVPTQPEVLDTFDTSSSSFGVEAMGNRVYVANGYSGILVADVSGSGLASGRSAASSSPIRLWDVRVQGTTALRSPLRLRLSRLSMSRRRPSWPSWTRRAGWGFLNALDVTGNITWVAAQTGLRVVDISTPTNLTSISFNAFGGQPRDVVHAGDVYLADDMYGMRQVDVTDPAAPVLRAGFPSADRGMGVDADGSLVVLAAGETAVLCSRPPT